MIFKHLVKYNGVYYPAGMDVPVGETKPVEKKVVEETVAVEQPKEDNLTKTDINRMSVAELKELANKEGISGVDDMTGAELKKVLINHFGL